VFKHQRGQPPPWKTEVQAGNLPILIEQAKRGAYYAASFTDPTVFSPAMCTFTKSGTAKTRDVAEGLALIVELDEGDTWAALGNLENMIGHPSLVVRSGGEWTDPKTAKVFPKLHAYWRLSEPTRTEAEHVLLYGARRDAARLIGADPTGKAVVHCFRWPGSVNRKNPDHPVLCSIERSNQDAEIHLIEAAEILAEAVEATAADVPRSNGSTYRGRRELIANPELVAAAMATIPNPDLHYDEWIRWGYAVCAATAGSGFDIWEAWSRKSSKHDDGETQETWKRICDARPDRIGAGSIFAEAKRHGWSDPRRKVASAQAPADHDPGGKRGWRRVAEHEVFPPGCHFDVNLNCQKWVFEPLGTAPGPGAPPPPPVPTPNQPPPRTKTFTRATIDALTFAAGEDAAIAPKLQTTVVRGILHKGSITLVYGMPKSGKSFLATDLALAIADPPRAQWMGHRILQHGPVLYVACEGHGGFWKRLRATGQLVPAQFILAKGRPRLIINPDATGRTWVPETTDVLKGLQWTVQGSAAIRSPSLSTQCSARSGEPMSTTAAT
jgi:hypothetical protein